MLPFLAAALNANPLLVEVTAGSFTTSTLSPTDAVCQFRLTSGGVEQADEGSGFSTTATWLLGGSAGDYECRYTGVTGDTGSMTLGSLDTWENLGTTRAWAISDTTGPSAAQSVTGTLEIGFAGANTAIVSATLTLTADEGN